MGKLYDDYVYYMSDSTGFNNVATELKNWNDKMEHGNVSRYNYAIQRTQDYYSAVIINKNVHRWRANQQSTFIDQAEEIIRCTILLHAITLTSDESARNYFNGHETSAKSRFNDWIKSYEYERWVEAIENRFPLTSIQQYYQQLCIVRIIPKWIEGILGDDKTHKARIDGSPVLYYLGMGATYEGRDTLALNVYFAPMKNALKTIVTLMISMCKQLKDAKKVHENLCNYLMENIINCDYSYAANDDIRILSHANNKHQVTTMFGRTVELCGDYYIEKETPYDSPP
jgi:hypothetical protein